MKFLDVNTRKVTHFRFCIKERLRSQLNTNTHKKCDTDRGKNNK